MKEPKPQSGEQQQPTDEELRIKVAELCGWLPSSQDSTGLLWGYRNSAKMHARRSEVIPFFSSDLNAMHEVERMMTHAQQEYYSFSLSQGWLSDSRDNWRGIHATARQRAEAFVKTLCP